MKLRRFEDEVLISNILSFDEYGPDNKTHQHIKKTVRETAVTERPTMDSRYSVPWMTQEYPLPYPKKGLSIIFRSKVPKHVKKSLHY